MFKKMKRLHQEYLMVAGIAGTGLFFAVVIPPLAWMGFALAGFALIALATVASLELAGKVSAD